MLLHTRYLFVACKFGVLVLIVSMKEKGGVIVHISKVWGRLAMIKTWGTIKIFIKNIN